MLGGLSAYIAAEISGRVKRNATIYGLYVLAGFLLVCAAAYALGALHSMLALSLGTVQASLWIAGGLMLLAIIALLTAIYLKSRPRPSRPMAKTALVAAPIAMQLLGRRMNWKLGAIGGVLILGLLIGRQFFGSDADGDLGE